MLENDWKLRKDGVLLRDALCEYLEELYGKIRFLEEKTIGRVRADMIAVLPDRLVGIEIKSHSDSYARLKSQIRGYDQFCDYNFLCVGSIHTHAKDHLPNEWGIVSITVRNGVSFEMLRPPLPNPKCSPESQLRLLWRDELSHILRLKKLPRYAGKSKKFICQRLCDQIPPETLKSLLCDRLFERDYTKYKEDE